MILALLHMGIEVAEPIINLKNLQTAGKLKVTPGAAIWDWRQGFVVLIRLSLVP